jgi:hypothetical protein
MSLHTTLTKFINTYLQTISEHPKVNTELEFRIGQIDPHNNFQPGYVVPQVRAGDPTPIDPERVKREVTAFSRLREALEAHTKAHPSTWSVQYQPETVRSYHANDLRQSITQTSHVVERKTNLKQLMIHSNGILQVRGAISLEQQFHFEPNSPEAIALRQNPPKAVCVFRRISFTEVVESSTWGNVTFRYDLTQITPPKATKTQCSEHHSQYHGELELVSFPNLGKSPDHVSYLVELLLLRFHFLLGNCIVTSEEPFTQIPITPHILYCHGN